MALQVVGSSPTLSRAGQVYWVGNDGNIWLHNADGSASNLGAYQGTGTAANLVLNGAREIANPGGGGSTGGSTGGTRLAAPSAPVDPDAAERAALKGSIKSRAGDIEAIYNALFGDVDNVIRTRDAELTQQYGGQRKKATEQFTEALPVIDQSYAALGSYDSTQRGDSRGKAKKGYEDTLGTIGSNERTDKDKLGQYGNEQRAKIGADKASAQRNLGRVDETSDVGALRSMRNEIETNLDTAGVTRAQLGTGGRQQVAQLTGDNGRFDAAVNALDSILKSSLGSDVKQAAVKAVTDSAGLSEDEKQKVQAQFGNVYAEQAAL